MRFTPSVITFLNVVCISAAQLLFNNATYGQNATSARHDGSLASFSGALNQDAVEVKFDVPVTFSPSASTTGFTVEVNGTSVTLISAGAVAADVIRIQFDAHLVTGNTAAITGINVGNTLRVKYTSGAGNLKVTAGLAAVNSFNLLSSNSAAPDCTDWSFNQQGQFDPSNVDICDPVKPTPFYEYILSKRYRNSSLYNASNPALRVRWNDPSATVVNYLFSETYTNGQSIMRVNPNNQAVISGTNPFSYPATDAVCEYSNTIFPIFNVSGTNCVVGALVQSTTFRSYAKDNENTGSLVLDPTPTATSNLICLGSNANVIFDDNTNLNCRSGAGLPNSSPNEQKRWVRFLYGFPTLAAAATIPNIVVNGVPLTDASGNYIGPVGGYFVTGAGGPNVEDFVGVVEIPANVTTTPQSTKAITTTSPAGQIVGQKFNITMQYWNVCNQYSLGTPTGSTDLVNFVQIITSPPAISYTPNPSNFCEGQANTNYNLTQSGGSGGTYKWYSTFPLVVAGDLEKTGASFNPVTEASLPTAGGTGTITSSTGSVNVTGTGTAFLTEVAVGQNIFNSAGTLIGTIASITNNTALKLTANGAVTQSPTAKYYYSVNKNPAATTTTNFYLTETLVNGCESLPTTVPFKVVKNVTGGTITHPGPNPICSGTVASAFGSSALPTGGVTPGTYTYQWKESTTSGSGYVNSVGTNATAATGFQRTAALTQTMFFVREATSGSVSGTGTCTVALSNEIQITVDTTPTAGTVTGDQTICESPGNPAAFVQTVAPTGGNGTYTYQWQSATAIGGPYSNIALATGVTYDPPAGLLVTTYYRRIVTSGVCATNTATSSPSITVTVNNLVNAGTIGTAQSICSGDTPVGLTGTPATGGDGTTYTYQWEVSTTGPAGVYSNAPGASTSQNYNPPALTATPQHYNYRRKATSGLCSSVYSNIIQITVNALPTANVSGGGSVCAGNPAPDVVFTFTGTGPFDLVYAIGGVNQPAQNNITSPFNISNPGVGVYTIVSIADSNVPTCTIVAPSANITGSATVTVSATPPPTVETFTATAAVCDDTGTTNPPDALLDLLPNSVQTYNIGYKLKNLNTLAETIVAPANFTSDASGVVSISPTYPQLGNAPEPLGYQIIITSIFNTVSLCAGAVPINGPTLIVNPRPAVPTGAINNISCSSGSGVALSVADPGAGFEIKWSTSGPAVASFVAAAPGSGVESGTRNLTFTPTSSATATFYAFTRNTTTGCLSSTGVAVTQTQDTAPAAAVAGPAQPNICGLTSGSPVVTLASTPANSGGNGTWTVPGKIAYYQNFENFAVGTTSSTAYNGWTRDVSAANAFPQQGGSGYFEVKAGKRFEAQNTNGNLGAGAGNIGELVWSSAIFDISAVSGFPAVSAFVDVTNVSNDLDAGADADYVKVFYKLNSGAETPFTTNGNLTGNFATSTASVSGLSGNTLQIIIRVSTNAATETVAFDNIVVKDPTSTITFSDANSPTSSVSNLPAPLPGGVATPTTLKWTVASALGACPTTSSTVTITINPLATTLTITPQLCDDVTGAPFQAANIDLTSYSGSVSNAIGLGGTIDWYLTTGDRTAEINKIVAPITITNGQVLYFRAKRAAPLNACANDGQTTFTVNALPAAIDKTYEFCEDAVNAGVATGINLTSFEMGALGVTSGGTGATRDVEWYEDNAGALGALITGASETNYSISATKMVHAKVIDLTSPVTPKCFDIADVVLTYKKKPVNNPLTGDGTVCTGTSIRVYQVSSATNNYGTVHNYNWTISGGGVSFEVFNGVGFVASTNYVVTNTAFLLLVRYPNAGNFTITASETIDGCTGNTDSFGTIVSGAPVPLVFASPATQVCKGATQSYSLTSANGGSQYNWTVIGGTIIGSSTTIGSATINVIWGTSTLPQPNVSVTETNSNGCPGTPASVDVTLNDVPQMTSANNGVICSGAAPSSVLPFVASPGTNTFNWKIVTATANVTFAGSAAIPTFPSGGSTGTGNVNHLLFNTSGVIGTVVYEVTPTEGDAPSPPDCSGNPQTVTITVNPEPVVNTVTDITVCSGDPVPAVAFSANTSGGETFNWSNTNTSIGLLGSGIGNIAGYTAPINFSGLDIVGTITVTATKSGCTSTGTNSKTFTITIKPQPVVNAIANITVCSGGTITVPAFTANTAGGETFSWTNTNTAVGLAASGTASIASFTAAANLTGSNVSGIVTVTASKNGCTSTGANSKSFTITVQPAPVVAAIANISVCPGDMIGPIAFSANTGGGETFNWTNTDTAIGLAATGSGNIASYVAPANNTGVNIVATIGVSATAITTCSGAPTTFTITIKPQPVVAAISNISVCSGDPIAAINFSANTGGGEVFAWTNTNTAIGLLASGSGGIAAYTAPVNISGVDIVGTITVSATKNSCTSIGANTKSFTITIKPQPVVSAIANVSVCSGDPIAAIPFSANTGGGETFDWSNNNISIGLAATGTGNIAAFTAPNNFTGVDIVATITVVATKNSCVSTGVNTKSFTITVKPQPVVAALPNISVCSGDAIAAINFSANTGGSETFNWTNTNTSIGLAASGIGSIGAYTAPNNFTGVDIVGTITVTATKNGCTSTGSNSKTFTVTIKPQPVVAAIANVSVCSGDAVPAINFSANTAGGETFNWTNSNPSVGLSANGTGNIGSYTAPNNFTGSDIVATLIVSATKNSCVSTGANTKSFTITIRPQPVVTTISNISVCSGDAVSAINFSANTGGGETFDWTNTDAAVGIALSGSGNIAAYTAPNNFTGVDIVSTVTVTATKNSCVSAGGNIKSFTITIKPQPVVAAIANISVCSGDLITVPGFTANTGGGETFNWSNTNTSIGIGSTGTGNISSYTAPNNFTGSDIVGTITVSATKNGCTSTGVNSKTFTITIRPQPVVSAITNVSVCSGGAIAAINFSANTGGSEVFNWSNTNTAIGLAATGTGSIGAYTAPINISGVDIVGTITVSATKNSCTSTGSNSKTFTITIKPEPVVSNVTDISVCSGSAISAINFIANTGGGETFNWSNTNTGIGIAASGIGAIGSYTAPTNFTGADIVGTITVTATKNGCTSTGANREIFTITIKPEPVVAAITDVSVCSGNAVPAIPFTANTLGGETFNWTNNNPAVGLAVSGTGNIASYTAPINLSGSDIVSIITVTATKNGCTSAGVNLKMFTITIKPEPVVSTISNISVCSGEAISAINFSANTGGGETFNWTNTNAAIGKPISGTGNITAYTAPTNFTGADIVGTITVSATKNGCTSVGANTKTFTITIKPQPVVDPITAISVCSGDVVPSTSFTANTGGGEVFSWSNDNTLIGVGSSGTGTIASYTAPNNYTGSDIVGTITVTATKNGCTSAGANSKTFTITIKPQPVVTAITNVSVCSGGAISAINFSANTGGSEVFNWTNTNTLIGLAANGTGAITGYTAPNNFTGTDIVGTITVTATKNGCTSTGSNSKTFTITIKPQPVVNNISNVTVCSGDVISAIAFGANTAGGETFNWTNNNTSIGLSGSGIGNIASYTAPTNTSLVDIVATITVSATKNSCTSSGANSKSFIITIQPEPLAPALTTIGRCSGQAINFDLQTIVNGVGGNSLPSKFTYTITSAVPSGNDLSPAVFPGMFDRLTASTALITETFSNFTNHDVTLTYNVVPYSQANNCDGTPFTLKVIIHPEPVGQDFTDPLCATALNHDIQTQITNGVTSKFTYTVSSDNVGVAAAANRVAASSAPITDVYTNTSGVVANITYTITAISTADNCTGALTFNYVAKIFPTPVGVDTPISNICSDVAFTVDPQVGITNGVAITKYDWTANYNGLTINGSAPPSGATNATGNLTATLTNQGSTSVQVIYTIIPYSGSCAGVSYKLTKTIDPEPVVATNLNETKCSRDVYGKLLATNGTSIGASTYDVTVVSKDAGLTGGRALGLIGGGGSVNNVIQNDSYTNTTAAALKVVYSVVPHGTNGCVGDAKLIEFTVKPEPVLSVPAPPAICSSNLPNNPSSTGIVLGTNGTSVNAQSYRIDQILYNGAAAAPAGFTLPVTNKTVGSSGGINHIQTDSYTNTSLVSVTVKYTITPISLAGCAGVPTDISIVVNPEPKLDPSLSPTPICSGDKIDPAGTAFQLKSDASSVASASFIIRSISFPGITAGGSNTGIGSGKTLNSMDNDTYVNVTTGPLTATYTIAPVTALGCIGPDQTVVITVNPAPAMKSGLDRIVCNDGVSNIVLQDNSPTTIGATNYDLISVKVGGVSIAPGATVGGLTANSGNSVLGISNNTNRIKNDKFTNLTNDRIVVTYEVVPISVAGCRGPQAAITLTVEPQAVSATVNAAPDICSGSAINLTFTSPTYSNGDPTNPVVTFSYTMLAVSGVTGNTLGNNLSEGTVITDVLVNSTDNPITVHYKVTPRAAAASNGAGCTGTIEDVAIIVQPRPKITSINNKTVCEGEPINLNLVSTTVPSTGSIKFFVTAVPSSTNVTGFINGSFIANSTLLSDALANNGSVTESVTYTIEPRNVDGANATICAGPSIDVVVTVSPRPNITPIADFSICSGEPFNPIAIVTDTETAIPGSTLVTWTATPESTITGESNGAGNSFSQVLFNNSSDKKTVVYTINAKNISNSPSCSGTPITLNVTVYPIPKIVSLPSSVNVCNNGTLSPDPYVLTSSVVSSLTPVFDWTVDDGTNPDLPDLSSVTNGTQINQTFVNNGSFLGTYQYTITPHLTIPASANPMGSNVCTGQDGIMVVNVAPPVNGEIYGFDITGAKANTLFMCKGSNEFIYIDPVGLPLMEVKYKEGATEKTLTKLGGLNILKVSPSVTTIYELISVKDKFGCVKDINQTVTVNVDAVSNEFSVLGPEISCSPFQVQFQYNQVAGVNYTWKWLDGPDSTTYQATATVAGKIIKHTFANPSPSTQAKFKVSLEAFLDTTKYLAGCKKLPFVKEIKIYPTITTGVFPDNTVLCSGETVKFVNTSQGVSATGHKWFYRVQGSTQELDVLTTANISYTLVNASASNPIIYEVVYRATNGNCPAADVVTPITVYRGANPGFNEGDVPPYIGGHSIVTYTNTTVPIDANDFRYEWEFGTDGKPSSANGIGPFTIDYTTPGEKDVVLTVTNIGAETDGRSCVSEFRKTINILLLPLASSFKATPQAACFPSNITVVENTATGDLMEWKVVDSNGRVAATSNANLPVFEITNPGKYSIFLKTSSSFTGQVANSQQDNFEIYPTPVASFDARPTLLFVPDTELNTFNFTTGATDYLWDFGDNGTSSELEPKYKYKIEGVYDLTLIAYNDHGNGVVCSDTLSRKITAKQGGVTKVPNAFTPNPNGSNGGVSTNGSFNDVFLPYVKGAEEFNMQIFDRWGNLIFESNNSTIGWDGYDRHGRLLPSGVYVYKLTLRLSDGQRTTQIGDITMIR